MSEDLGPLLLSLTCPLPKLQYEEEEEERDEVADLASFYQTFFSDGEEEEFGRGAETGIDPEDRRLIKRNKHGRQIGWYPSLEVAEARKAESLKSRQENNRKKKGKK